MSGDLFRGAEPRPEFSHSRPRCICQQGGSKRQPLDGKKACVDLFLEACWLHREWVLGAGARWEAPNTLLTLLSFSEAVKHRIAHDCPRLPQSRPAKPSQAQPNPASCATCPCPEVEPVDRSGWLCGLGAWFQGNDAPSFAQLKQNMKQTPSVKTDALAAIQ